MPLMKPADLAILQGELAAHPAWLATEPDGRYVVGDSDISRQLNAPIATGGTIYVATSLSVLVELLMDRGVWDVLHASTLPADVNLCYLLDVSQEMSLSPEDAEIKNLFQQAVVAGSLTAADATAIRDLVEEPEYGPSRAEVLGLGEVFPKNVRQARGEL